MQTNNQNQPNSHTRIVKQGHFETMNTNANTGSLQQDQRSILNKCNKMQTLSDNICSICNRGFNTQKGLKIHQNTCKLQKQKSLIQEQQVSVKQQELESVVNTNKPLIQESKLQQDISNELISDSNLQFESLIRPLQGSADTVRPNTKPLTTICQVPSSTTQVLPFDVEHGSIGANASNCLTSSLWSCPGKAESMIQSLYQNNTLQCQQQDQQLFNCQFMELTQEQEQSQIIHDIMDPTIFKETLSYLNSIIYRNQACLMFSAGQQCFGNVDVCNNYFKYMMKNPKDLSMEQLQQMYPWNNCIIQAKADGVRCLLYIEKQQLYLVFEQYMRHIGYTQLNGLYVFECEYMTTQQTNGQRNSLLVYDMHMWNNEETFKDKYFYRIWKLRFKIQEIINTSTFNKRKANNASDTDKSLSVLSYIKQKPFISINRPQSITQLQQIFTEIQTIKCTIHPNESIEGNNREFVEYHHTDGIIINTNNILQFQHIYKWKPKDQLTIDFLCKRTHESTISHLHYSYQLYSYNSSNSQQVLFNSPIIDCSSTFQSNNTHLNQVHDNLLNPNLDNKVAEFLYKPENDTWSFIRIRPDKVRGNALNTARNIMANLLYNISFEMLVNGTETAYFEFKRTTIYANMTRYVNYIKQIQIQNAYKALLSIDQLQIPTYQSQIIIQANDINGTTNTQIQEKQELDVTKQVIALDLGCGKGQDIHKFSNYSTVYCVDNDKYALWELSQRASSLNSNTKIRIIQTDLSTQKSIMSLPNNIDVLNCNIALHYFIDTFPLIVKKTNPKFINLLIIDGSKLKESETLYEDSNVKYHYNKIKDSANKEVIQVKLPFQSQLNQEQVIYPAMLISMLNSLGYRNIQYQSLMDSHFSNNCQYTNSLTVADQQHISHYSVLQFDLNPINIQQTVEQ